MIIVKRKIKPWHITCCLAGLIFICLTVVTVKTFILKSNSDTNENRIISKSYRLIAAKSLTDLTLESNLIGICTFKDVSEPFQIVSTSGGEKIFKDYYFSVNDTFRGEKPENGIVTVRIEGGTVGNTTNVISDFYEFQVGETYILFLYHPGMGGGFNTAGDYYYITGSLQGIYPYTQSAPLTKSSTVTLESADGGDFLDVNEFQAEVLSINNEFPAETNAVYQEFLENQQKNLDSGFISQEEYDSIMAESQQYATYVGDPPAGYSGSEE